MAVVKDAFTYAQLVVTSRHTFIKAERVPGCLNVRYTNEHDESLNIHVRPRNGWACDLLSFVDSMKYFQPTGLDRSAAGESPILLRHIWAARAESRDVIIGEALHAGRPDDASILVGRIVIY